MTKQIQVYPKVGKTHDNFRKISYGNKRASSGLYQNSSLNDLFKIQKVNIQDQYQTSKKCTPIVEEKLLSQEKLNQDENENKKDKIIRKVYNDPFKDFPFVFCALVVIVQAVSGIAQIGFQIFLFLKNTPLNFLSAGVWSGMFGLLVSFIMFLVIIKRNYKLYIVSMVLNSIAILIFIALAIINSLSIIFYDNASTQFIFEKQFRWANFCLMSLGFLSFICSIFYIFLAQNIIT